MHENLDLKSYSNSNYQQKVELCSKCINCVFVFPLTLLNLLSEVKDFVSEAKYHSNRAEPTKK